MIFLSERDVAQLVSTAEAVELLEAALRAQAAGDAQSIPRIRARNDKYVLHVLPATAVGPQLGAKLYLTGGPSVRFIYLLFGSAGLEAMIAADHMGRMRTGAASGLATKYLAKRVARHLVVVGAGHQSYSQIEAIAAVRPIERVTICGRTPERAQCLAETVRQTLALHVDVSDDIASAVASADVISTVTASPEPVFSGTDLSSNVHINAVGSNRATHREIDHETLARASVIVADDVEQARSEAGDLLRNPGFDWTRVQPLARIFSLTEPPSGTVTLFESLGIGLWDLAMAVEVVKRARERQIGRQIDLDGFFASP